MISPNLPGEFEKKNFNCTELNVLSNKITSSILTSEPVALFKILVKFRKSGGPKPSHIFRKLIKSHFQTHFWNQHKKPHKKSHKTCENKNKNVENLGALLFICNRHQSSKLSLIYLIFGFVSHSIHVSSMAEWKCMQV